MLDFVLVLVILVLTAATFLYEAGCERLLTTDTTRDAGPTEPPPA
jgi:hypothetical protein